jgi:hypothetical protein
MRMRVFEKVNRSEEKKAKEEKGMLTKWSKTILTKGDSIEYGCYDAPNGTRYLARYQSHYYLINDDGTGNGFFDSGEPVYITKKEAQRLILLKTYNNMTYWDKVIEDANAAFGWHLSSSVREELIESEKPTPMTAIDIADGCGIDEWGTFESGYEDCEKTFKQFLDEGCKVVVLREKWSNGDKYIGFKLITSNGEYLADIIMQRIDGEIRTSFTCLAGLGHLKKDFEASIKEYFVKKKMEI